MAIKDAQPRKSKKKAHVHRDFAAVLVEITADMPRHKRIFSRFIHLRSVSAISDFLGATVARPNALLCGAVFSFTLTLGTYLLAKNLGYRLSGSEPLVAFGLGWAIGLLYDAANHLVKKK